MNLSTQYDGMSDEYAEHAADSPYNAHYDRPAMLECLGDVAGLDVLDAACGPGLYLEELIARGAGVVGFDGSAEMVELARARTGNAVRIDQTSLDDPLPYPDDSFDVVLSALAIHYAADRDATFREFFRVLRLPGRCLISTQHPTTDWLRMGGSYFDVVLETDIWKGHEMRFWREPLGELCRAATDAGFLIRRVIEPLPAASMRTAWPESDEKLRNRPGFLILDLVKI